MVWIASFEKDTNSAALGKRLWDTRGERAKLKAEYDFPVQINHYYEHDFRH